MTRSSTRSGARRRMAHALAKLEPIEREVLMLNANEGLDLADVALRLGIPLQAAQRHLANALCRIDRLLEARRRAGR